MKKVSRIILLCLFFIFSMNCFGREEFFCFRNIETDKILLVKPDLSYILHYPSKYKVNLSKKPSNIEIIDDFEGKPEYFKTYNVFYKKKSIGIYKVEIQGYIIYSVTYLDVRKNKIYYFDSELDETEKEKFNCL
ncbi:hypothetical protein EDC44_1505 [Cricetibacter osteomyelitidis]|uniref:Uncharacterized protein n=1 Tax=Cricetibacter osteomyelitidis TaxID=1521931 RepID=A0A4R2SIS2_9PAST|nr:hypothetical protein [Cricetibacter osteomyelitidis]TCP88665.1 hypothetical protein EDC44_1505 [Cricetibacter osteomyelitidis]